MSQKVQKTIEINAKVKTSLEDMSKTIRQLEDGLSKQKFDLGKTSGLSKLIKDYKEAKTELDELMQGDQIARADIKKAENLGDKVSKLYKKIAISFKELQGGNEEVFKNLFPSKFVTQITKGTQAIDKFFQKLDAKGIKNTKVNDLTKEVQTLETELSQLKNRRIKVEIDVDKEKVSKELQRINNEFDNMRQNFKKKLFPDEEKDSKGRTNTQKLNSSVATWSNKLTQDREARKNLKVADLTKAQKTQITKLEGQLTDSAGSSLIESERKRLQALQAEQRKRETIAKTPGARDTSRSRREYGGVADKELSAQIAASEKELQRLKAIADKIEDIKQQPQKAYDAAVKNLETRIKTDRTNLEKAEKALAEHQSRREEEEKIAAQKTEDFMSGKSTAEATQEEIEALKKLNQERQEAINLEKKLKQEEGFKSQESKDSAISKKESTIANKRREIEALNNEIKNLTNETNLDEFFQKLKELGVNTEGIEHTHEGLEQIKKDLKDLNTQTTEAIRKQLLELGYDSQEADKKVDVLGKGMEELGDKDKDLRRAENEMENLKNQVLQFFSLTNSVQLFKRAVSSAMNTIKELDATMTEAAVVTDFSVGDMWDKLPQYSKEAQQLGVSINGMYQATTLYYQQGLKTNEAMALGVETMKMAKIASMDSTEATKAMTSALRGFNMELNETSATRVNDVYSQLAAVTAADTAQIATAMEKTASIAASANMEFETTAALLAQIIETTQEAPETAGTAMKTIIARFSEVKSLQNQGLTSGKDSEGEDLDVNKIQTALKTVGISMDGFFQGTEGLDSVLLKLAEKWDTLDFQTQRYIATTAAGSRQQSRFIAMMSDYARTTELVGEAQNSAGASQRQFEKTQDSMEAKLQKLKNAWDQFLMGLSNNEILKGAVDFLTFVIDKINKLTDALSGGNGLIKSVVSLITVINALKLGKNLLGSAFGEGLRWAGEQMGASGGNSDSSKASPEQKKTFTKNPTPMPDPQGAGRKAGENWAASFLASVIKRFDAGKQTVEKGAEGLTPTQKKKTAPYNRQQKKAEKKYIKENTEKLGKITDKDKFKSEIFQRNLHADKGKKVSVNTVMTVFETEGAEAAVQKYKELGGELLSVEERSEIASIKSKSLDESLTGAGQAAMLAGTAISLLGSLFETMGLEDAAETCDQLGAALMGVGAVLMTLPGIINTVATVAELRGITVQAAWWWLVAIIAVIALLVVGVMQLCKAWEAASEAAQLEKMNEQLDSLNAAVDEAKQKLQDMADARDDLKDMQKTFSGLTKGTKEWRQALIENNKKVLDLIDAYPQLIDYVSKGINGELIISEEGWDQAIAQQQEAYISTLGAETVVAQQVQDKEQYIKTEDSFSDKTGQGFAKDTADFFATDEAKDLMSGAFSFFSPTPLVGMIEGRAIAEAWEDPSEVERRQTGGLTYDEFNDFAAASAKKGLSLTGGSLYDEFKTLYLDMGYDAADFDSVWKSMQKLGTSFDELSNSAMTGALAEQVRTDAIISSVVQTSEAVQNSKEFGKTATDMVSQSFGDYKDRVKERADEYLEDMDVDDKYLDDNDKAVAAIEKYAEIMDISEAEVRRQITEKEITKEDIAQIIAADEINKEAKEAAESTIKILERVSKGKSDKEIDRLKGLINDRGLGTSIDNVQGNPTSQEDMKKYLKEQGFTFLDALNMGYNHLGEMAAAMATNAKDAEEAYKNAFNAQNTYGMGDVFEGYILTLNDSLKDLGSATGLTIAETQKLANSLARVTANGGDAAALLRQFPSLLEGLSGKDLDNAINLLATTDWTTQDGIESTIAALESLGVTVEDHMVEQLYIATQAVKKFDLSAMEEKLSNLQSLIDKVTEKADEGSKSFTKEERDALVAGGFGEDMFVRIGIDEYTFMGDTESLLASIENYVSAILGEMRGDVDEAVAKGEGFDEVFQNDGKMYAVGDGTEGSTTGKEMTGEQIIQRLATGELDTLGVGGTNNVGTDTLKQLVRDTGVLDDVDWSGYTDYMLAEALVQGYTNYYGPGGIKYKQNKETQNQVNSETLSIEYAQAVGTREFYNLYEQDLAKRQKTSEIEGITVGTSALGWEYGAFHQSGRNQYENIGGGTTSYTMTTDANGYANYHQQTSFDPQQLLQSVATQEDFAELYQYDPTVLSGMRGLGVELGINGAAGMDFDLLQQQLTAYYESMSRGDEVLDALIASETGLDLVLEQTNEELNTQGINCEENSAMVRQLVLTSNQANKSIDKLNDVLEEQGDILKNADKKSDAYKKSLSLVTNAAKEVFGKHIDAKFIEENIELFEDLAEGGETAAAAWKAISEKSGQAFLSTLNLTEEQLSGIETQMAALDGMNLDIGGSANFSDIFTQLANVMNSADEAEAYIESLGGYEVEWVQAGSTINELTGEEMPNYIAIVKKTDQTGTGSKPSTGGGGGGGDKWENPYDKLHNVLEEINDLLREREKLERRYQRLISQGTATAEKLSKISNDNINNYQDEIAKQEYVIAGRKAQVQAKIKANSDMEKYVYTDIDAMGNETIRIDWDAINGITDSEEGEKVSEFYDNIDEWLESIYDAENSILDAEDGIWEELQQGKDEYLDLEEQVKEAIVNERQKEID